MRAQDLRIAGPRLVGAKSVARGVATLVQERKRVLGRAACQKGKRGSKGGKRLPDTVAPVQQPKFRPRGVGVATPDPRPTALPSAAFIDRPDASKLGHSWPGLPTSLQVRNPPATASTLASTCSNRRKLRATVYSWPPARIRRPRQTYFRRTACTNY